MTAFYEILSQNEYNDREDELIRSLESLVQKDILITPKNKNIRVRHVIKYGFHFYLLFNDGEQDILIHVKFAVNGVIFARNFMNN